MTTTRPIPDPLAELIEDLRWPLGPDSSPPLHTKGLEEMKKIRQKTGPPRASSNGLPHAMALDVLGMVNLLVGNTNSTTNTHTSTSAAAAGGGGAAAAANDDQVHFARIATAALLLGHGYTDEAHALVSPLTWTQPTPFGFGPPVITSPEVLATGSYLHSLIHRREGFHDSEFGMDGFGNAHFWASSTTRDAAVETLPIQKIHDAAFGLAMKYPHSPEVQKWVLSMKEHDNVDGWEPRLVHDLCEASIHDDSNLHLRDFAEKVSEIELRLMLSHVLHKLGFSCDDCLRDF